MSSGAGTVAGGAQPYRSKTLATWIAVLGGALGLHRFYLHGFRDPIGWLFPAPTFAGLLGVQRVFDFGQDDRLAWVLIPLLGLSLSVAMFSAIVIGLTPDERWDERRNAGRRGPSTGWGPVLGVVLALMLGAGVLTGTIAYGGQRFFEWQIEAERAAERAPR